MLTINIITKLMNSSVDRNSSSNKFIKKINIWLNYIISKNLTRANIIEQMFYYSLLFIGDYNDNVINFLFP